MNDIVHRVRAAAGGPARLAAILGVTTSAVSQWRRVPIDHVAAIEAHLGIPRAELRPDVFTPPTRRRHPMRRATDRVSAATAARSESDPESAARAEGGTLALPGEG